MINAIMLEPIVDFPATLHVKVRPSASRTRYRDTMADGTLKIDIAAPPEDGKANAELVRFLAEELGVGKGDVEIVAGGTGKKKVIRVSGQKSVGSGQKSR